MSCVEKFIDYQKASREEFLKWEERRLIREGELEAKRRREDREHELRLFQLLSASISGQPPTLSGYHPFPPNSTGFIPDNY